MVNWEENYKRLKFLYDLKCKEYNILQQAHNDLLGAMADPDAYLLENIEAQNEL